MHSANGRAPGFCRKAGSTEAEVTVPLEGRPGERGIGMVVER
ncbi:hypothetical protein ACFU5P_17405 [Streptomyces sp. NPDC057433]